ncbi:MAG: SHOCT domain-containing protein [Gammaproteobacteria bacterium]
MKSSIVRELARRYAAGELSFEEYRAQRRDLINAVTSGEQLLEHGQVRARRSRKRSRLWWLVLIPLAVIIAGGIAASLWVTHRHSSGTHVAHVVTPQETGASLVRSFIETDDWSDASVNRFLQRWKALPAREQNVAHDSYLFPRLLSQLREQIVSQRAMLELAPDPHAAAAHLSRLEQMAVMLGVGQEQ